MHPKVASEMLGHSTVGFTLTVYSHLIAGMGRAGADAMETALGEALASD